MISDVPPAIVQKAVKAPDTSAQTQADKRAREAARRAVEAATRNSGRPKTSGR
jgi:hypothetical protein